LASRTAPGGGRGAAAAARTGARDAAGTGADGGAAEEPIGAGGALRRRAAAALGPAALPADAQPHDDPAAVRPEQHPPLHQRHLRHGRQPPGAARQFLHLQLGPGQFLVWLFREVYFRAEANTPRQQSTNKNRQTIMTDCQKNDTNYSGRLTFYRNDPNDIMQSPIHGTSPPIAMLRPMEVALNCRDRTSSQAAPGWSSFVEPVFICGPPQRYEETAILNKKLTIPTRTSWR